MQTMEKGIPKSGRFRRSRLQLYYGRIREGAGRNWVRLFLLIAGLALLAGSAGAAPSHADFNANVTSGPAPLPVSFTDASNFVPSGWAWFFGDETYAGAWTLKNGSSGWPKRYTPAGAGLSNGYIVMMGGYSSGTFFNDTWRSSDYGTHWTLVNASSGWEVRNSFPSTALPNGNIVLTGGSNGTSNVLYADTWLSADNGAHWMLVNASSGWTKRSGHSMVTMPDGSIVLTGGYDGFYKNDTWRSLDNGAHWTLMNISSGWQRRAGHDSVAMPDGSIVLTGGVGGPSTYFNDTWRSTDNGAHWTLMNISSGWSAREGHCSVAMPDGSIVVAGGESGVPFKDAWRSTDNGMTWIRLPDPAWEGRHGHVCTAMRNGSIVLFGGNAKNDTWQLQPAATNLQNPVHTYTAPGTYTVALQDYTSNAVYSVRKTGYIRVSAPRTNIGVFRPSTHKFYLRPGNYPATPTTIINWGVSTDTPVTGDWNWDEVWDVGVFRNATHRFYLKNGSVSTTVNWGVGTDTPVTGDWNGDGIWDVGVFRNSSHKFYLKNGSVTTAVNWGQSTDTPVTGDWNGDGLWDVGVFRNSSHKFYLKNGSVTTAVNWGASTDTPVTGDWNGDGLWDVGVFRNATHMFYLKNGSVTTKVSWGQSTDIPVTGNWM